MQIYLNLGLLFIAGNKHYSTQKRDPWHLGMDITLPYFDIYVARIAPIRNENKTVIEILNIGNLLEEGHFKNIPGWELRLYKGSAILTQSTSKYIHLVCPVKRHLMSLQGNRNNSLVSFMANSVECT